MGDHREVTVERLYVKVPGTDKLRKNAAGRLRYLLATGWRELQRTQETEYIRVHLERTGFRPPMKNIPAAPPPQPRTRRDGGFGRGGPPSAQPPSPPSPPTSSPPPPVVG